MTDYIKREDAIERLSYHTDFVQSIYVCDGEEMLYKQSAIKEISDIPSADVVEVVRCKDCKWYEPAHILHSDGSKTYVDDGEPDVTVDVGINVGGQCVHHSDLKIYCTAHDRENPSDYENIVIFRKPDDYCSFGERAEA